MAEHRTPDGHLHAPGAEQVAHGPLVHREDLGVSHQMDHNFDDHGHGGLAKYFYVFIALCVLTSASFFTYSPAWPFKDQPQVGWAFMMAVSCTKAMLVILFFMHIKYEANWKYVLTIPAGMMSIFLMLMLVPDVGMRTNGMGDFAAEYSEERWLHTAVPETDMKHSNSGHPSGNHQPGGHSSPKNNAGEHK